MKTISANWQVFKRALVRAIPRIDERYFRTQRFQDDPAWRERAYCYELYHQLRLELGNEYPYTLHAEIDKAGHIAVTRAFPANSRPNPDFILHKPGTMENLVVMEVKVSSAQVEDIRADCEKLETFMTELRYRYGILLLFGESTPTRYDWPEDIIVLWHGRVGAQPERKKNERK